MTVRRYEKAGRLAIEVHKMPYGVQEYARRVEPLLGQMFLSQARCLEPPKIRPQF